MEIAIEEDGQLNYFNEPKTMPKQIPLFEEEDDGKLTPYKE